jgi:hypothetical protein
MLDCDDMNDLAPAFTPAVLIVRVFQILDGITDCVPFGVSLSASLAQQD